MRIPCHSWPDFENTVTLLEQPGAPKYDIVCVDHLDDMVNFAESTVLTDLDAESFSDEKLPWGKGWRIFKRTIMEFIQRLLKLDLGLVFICHDTIREVTIRGIKKKRTVPNIGKSAWNIIVPIVDLGGYCGQVTVKGADGKLKEVRFLATQPREDMWAKDRTVRRRPVSGQELLDGKAFIKTFITGATHGEISSTSTGIPIESEIHTPTGGDTDEVDTSNGEPADTWPASASGSHKGSRARGRRARQ